MKKTFIIISFLLLSITIWKCNQKVLVNHDRLFRPISAEFYHVPVGLCEDYPEETTTLEIIRKDMEFLKETRIDLLRISFGWDAIEPQKDKYDWLFWDDFVKMAVEDYGITLIPYICYMPKWNSTNASDTLYFWNYPPIDAERFGTFMKMIVTRYKKWIKTWELWNEPDIWVYWQGTPEEFAHMIKIGAKAVKEADPDAKVVLGGIAYREEFLEKLFKDYGLSPFIDIVNMHNYFETWSKQPVENIDDHILKMSEIITTYGNHQPLWVAEVGYSTFRQNSKVSSEYYAYYEYEHTPEYQAVDLFKRLALIAATEKISAVAWYEIKDLPSTDEVIGDEYNNRHLGIADVNHSPKPAQKSLMLFNNLFSQKYKNITVQAVVEKLENSDSHILVFQNEDGSVTVISWLQTNIPEKRPAVVENIVNDAREEKITVILPFEISGKVILYDQLGLAKDFHNVKKEANKTVLENIELKGGQVSIIRITK